MVTDGAGRRKLYRKLTSEETQTQAEVSHRPGEAAAIQVTSKFLELQMGAKPGLDESLSLQQ